MHGTRYTAGHVESSVEQTPARREQLLDTGLRLFSATSYAAVSIDDIAAAADISKGLLYHYFGGKKAFYVACVQRAADQMVEAVRTDPSQPPPVRAWTGLNAYLDYVEARSGVFTALLQGGQGVDPEVVSIIDHTRLQLAGQVLEGTGVEGSPVFQFAVRSYVGAVEAASVAWLQDRSVPRSVVVYTLLSTLQAIMGSAAALDPDAGFEVSEEMVTLLASLRER